jgi:hypothetical protein
MKQSILIAIVIFAVGAVPAILRHQQLTKLGQEYGDLVMEAGELGLSVETSTGSSVPHLKKPRRGDMEQQARRTVAEVIAFAREMEALEKSGLKPDAEFQKRALAMMAELMDLDAARLKQVIAELRENREISADTRSSIIAFSIMMLTGDHPEAAVMLFTESSDLLDKSSMGDHVISSALKRWAEFNPVAALEWIRNNQEKYPGIASDDAKCGVIAGAALNDPKLAFKLVSELEVENPETAIYAVLMSGHDNPEQRSAVLAALREHLDGIEDDALKEEQRNKALEIFARTSDQEGFDSLTKWISDTEFTAAEKAGFTGGLTYFTTQQDTGRWVEWMSENLPAENMQGPVGDLVGEWTQQDYLAAGKWLSSTPDGAAKQVAVKAYAEAVAGYEPQVAVQWAMTLPAGAERDSTLLSIYQNWPASDPGGAAAFAREHGFGVP